MDRRSFLKVRRVNKVLEGRPHIVDMIKNDEADFIINTTEGRRAIEDSAPIRASAEAHRVARQVITSLGMDRSPAIQSQWQEATQGKGQLADWLANLLQKSLEVKPSRESNVININYTGADPEFAAAVANGFAKAYMDVNLDLRLAPARQFAAFFEEQTKAAREKLEQAQSALSTYQQANGITSADERMDFETAKLNETSSQLTGVQGQTTDSQSKRSSGKADTVAEVMQNPLVNNLKSDVARLEAKLTESNVNLGKNHPQTQRTEAELATLRTQLDAEIRKVTTDWKFPPPVLRNKTTFPMTSKLE